MECGNKTEEELISELEDLKVLLKKQDYERDRIEKTLNERLKELNCHNRLSEIMSNSTISLNEVCMQVVQVIPVSWQFPEFAEASITIGTKTFSTPNFVKTILSLTQEVKVNQNIIGQIEVCYPVGQLPETDPVFLPEESNLLFSIAVKLGNYVGKEEKEIALRQSESKYKELIGNITDVIYTTDNQANITFISPSIKKLLGYSPEEIIGKNFIHFVGASREQLQKRFEEIHKKVELQNEYQILSKSGEPHWIRFSSKAIIRNDQFIGATGTLIDITEKKQIELELQKSESLYRSILTASPDTIFIADLESRVLFTSPMALKMFGYEEAGFPLNSPLFDFVDPKDHDKAKDAIRQMVEGIYTGATEYVGIKADGSNFNMEVNGEFIRDAEGQPTSMVFVVRDISDRKLAEQKLRKSESLYRSVLDASPDSITITDLTGQILFTSPRTLQMFGYDSPELLENRPLLDFIDEKSQDKARNAIMEMHQGIFTGAEEYTGIKANGTTFEIEVNGEFVKDEEGRPTNMIFVTRDISDRKLAEEKLRTSEEKYRNLVESVNDVIYEIDSTGIIKYASPSALQVLGYSVEEVLGRNIFSFVYPEDGPVILNTLKNLTSRNYSFMEYRYVRKDGSVRWVRSSTTPIINNGEMIGATGTLTDVTERRVAEEKLRKNEEQFRNLVTSINDAIYEINKEGIIQYISPVIEKIVGYTPEELIGKNTFNFMHPDDVPVVMAALAQLDHINVPYLEYRYLTKSGKICWIRTSTSPIFENGLLTGGRGTLTDITERKLAEEKVQETEQRFKLVFENVFDGISIFEEDSDPGNRILVDCNEQYAAMAGRSREELLKIGNTYSLTKTLEEDANELRIKGISEQKAYHGSFTWIRPDRKENTIEYIARPITWQGKSYSIGIDRDITDYKQKEDKLRKLSQAVEQSPVSIVITDLDGNIEYANPKASQTTGYTLEELKGKNPRVLKSGETPNDEYQYLWDSISHGNIWRGIFHNKRKNGELYWESSQITPITDKNGNITSYLAIKEDITDRKKIQEELAKSEDRFREITEQSQNVIWETNSEAVYTYVSQASEIAWGLKPSDLVGKKRFFEIHPEDGRKEFMEACLRQVQNGEQFRNMESLVQGDDGKMNWVMTNGMPYLDSEGNVKGYRGSSLNINQQKSAFEELRQSEERYKSIFRNNFSVMMIIDPETGYIKDVNTSACNYYKWTYDEMCSKNISEINVLTRKEINTEMQKAKEEKRTQFFFKHRLGNGKIRDVEVYSCPLKFGDSILLYSIVHDITERRLAEEALLQREQDLNFSQEIAGMGSWQLNMGTNTSMWSDNMYRIFGLDPDKDKASQDLFFELIHPDDRHLIDEYIEEIFRNRKQVTFEMRINLKSGKTIWIQNSMIPDFEGDQLVTLNGTNVDITEKKLTEEILRINEAALNQAQEISKMCSWELDLIAEKLTWSNNYYQLMGIPVGSEMSTQFFLERVHPEDIHLVDEKLEEMNLFKKPVTYDLRLRMPDNEYRWIQNNIVPEFENGKLIRYKGVNMDVTEKKLAEENIRQQNERLSAIINAIPDLIFISDREGTYLEFYNVNSQDLLYSADQLIGSTVRDVFDEETANLHIRKIEECLQTKNLVTYEYSSAINGTNHYFEARLAPLGNDKVLRFVRDFTQEKQKDAELKKLYLSIEQSPVITVITDLRAHIEYVNPAFTDITGYSREEVIGQNVRLLQSGKTDKTIYKQLWATIKAGKEWHGEWVNKKKNGELYWEDVLITPVRDDLGKVTNYLAVKQDVTQRKQNEEELSKLTANLEVSIVERTSELTLANYHLKDEIEERKRIENALSESEKRYTSMIANISDVIGIIGLDGVMSYKSPNITKYFGWQPEDLVGTNGWLTVHPDDLDRIQKEFYDVVQKDNAATTVEYRYLCKDGSYKPIELTATNLINDQIINGVLLNYHDITARKLAEEELVQMSSRLNLALRVGGIGVWDYNVVNNILFWDNQMFSIYGIREDDFSSAYDAWIKGLHPDDKIRGDEEIQMAIRGEKEFDTEFRVVWPDGSIHFVRALAAVERDDSGRALHMIGTNWDITLQKQAANFENEMLQLSTKLTGVKINEIDSALNLALQRIGQFLNADRAYIFEFKMADETMNNTHEWCNGGIQPEIKNLQKIPCNIFPHWMEILQAHRNIIIPSVQDLPENWQGEREILEPQGIQSLVAIPLLIENNIIGFVGLDSVKAKREYNSTEMNMLKVWSSMLSSLIHNKRTEGILEQTRQNYETFFNTIDDFLWVLDEHGNIIHTNNTVTNRLEYGNEELLNTSVLMVHPADRREEAGRIVGEMLTGITEFCPVPVVTKSGKQIPVETKVKAGFWNGVTAIFGVSKDITQIQLSEQKFSSAFHLNSAVMTITRFVDDQFVDVNNAFLSLFGYSRDEIMGKTLVTLGIVRENSEEGTIQDAINRGIAIREIEINAYTKSNEPYIFLLSAEEIYVGSERCILSVAVNITERKIMENELRKARIEADQANMAKSEFLSRMSHELRTPMNSILGFAQLLEMDELNPKQMKGVNHILTSGKHLLKLIDEVLDISRIEAGKLILSPEKVKVGRIIHEMLDSIQQLIASRHIKMELNISSSDEQPVIADQQRLKQVLLNLLTNAVKYNKEGGTITISTSFLPQSDGGDAFVRISISDTGNGISKAGMAKIFTPFERIGAEKTKTEGTGLGLSVVKKLMDAMDGNLGVKSTPGVGSTFWIELPLAGNSQSRLQLKEENLKLTSDLGVANIDLAFQHKEKGKRSDELIDANIELAFQHEEKEKRADELKDAKSEIDFLTGQNREQATKLDKANKELSFFKMPSTSPTAAQFAKTGTILYIEDNVSNIELIQQIIADQRPHIQLLSSFTGKETVRMAIDCAADLILLDLDLPDLYGSEVLEQLKADEITKNIPVVIISADAMPQQLERLMQAGAKDYITKPVDIIAFLMVIDEWIGRGN